MEPTQLAVVTGSDFRGLKGVIETLLEGLHVKAPLSARPAEIGLFAVGNSAELLIAGSISVSWARSMRRLLRNSSFAENVWRRSSTSTSY